MRRLRWNTLSESERTQALARPALEPDETLTAQVASIIAEVRRGGDAALCALGRRFDPAPATTLWQATDEAGPLPEGLADALERAIDTVSRFHAASLPHDVEMETAPGVHCAMRHRPLSPVGLYVPAGSAPLPSTALMLLVPARLAGCREIVLATPPNAHGRADDAVLWLAARFGLKRVLVAGGAQAIAAMAYGTESVPKCAKLFGPGNRFVAEAKRQVALDVHGAAQDLPAGPSEVMVIADRDARPEWVAIDLLSQAEHGPDSQVLLLTDCELLAAAVEDAIGTLLQQLKRSDIARKALQHASIVIVSSMDEAVRIATRYAPEHLIIQTGDARQLAERVPTAGSIFVGAWTPESLGDYIAGPNHTLPTGGWARCCSGLGVADFLRRQSVQFASADGLAGLGPAAATIAAHEGLDAHRMAIELRLETHR